MRNVHSVKEVPNQNQMPMCSLPCGKATRGKRGVGVSYMPIDYYNLKEPRYIGTKEKSWYCPACGKKYRNSLACWKEHFKKGLKHKFERLYEN